MGKTVNQVILMGRLTRDSEVRTTPAGKNVASFSLAVDKAGAEGADFFEITAWEKLADLVSLYTRKGSKVLVMGRLQQQNWEQDGQKRSKVSITATDVTFLDSKQDSTPQTQPKKDVVVSDIGDDPINLDDIPF